MILRIFIFWRIGLFIATFLGSLALPRLQNSGLGAVGPDNSFNYWASWAQWDGGHYYQIAQNGYSSQGDYAFFPLYPLLVKFVSTFTGHNSLFAGLLVSNISLLIFCQLFFKYLKKRYSPNVALNSVLTLLFFPTSFYLAAYYSESLFLLLTIITFLNIYKKNFLLAGIFSGLSSLTRVVGITLVVSSAYSYASSIFFSVRNINWKVIYPLLGLSGLFIYGSTLFLSGNNPFEFLISQSLWSREITDPISTVFSYAFSFLTGQNRPINDYFDFLTSILFMAVLIINSRKIPSSLWIFSILVILIPASSTTLTSMPRYVLSSLGAFLIFGDFLTKHQSIKIVIWSVSLFAQVCLATLFVNGHWIA